MNIKQYYWKHLFWYKSMTTSMCLQMYNYLIILIINIDKNILLIVLNVLMIYNWKKYQFHGAPSIDNEPIEDDAIQTPVSIAIL